MRKRGENVEQFRYSELSHLIATNSGKKVGGESSWDTRLERITPLSPFVGHELRLISQSGPAVSPIKELAAASVQRRSARECANTPRSSRSRPNTLKGHIRLDQAVGMEPACFKQQLKIGVVEMNQLSSQRSGILGPR